MLGRPSGRIVAFGELEPTFVLEPRRSPLATYTSRITAKLHITH